MQNVYFYLQLLVKLWRHKYFKWCDYLYSPHLLFLKVAEFLNLVRKTLIGSMRFLHWSHKTSRLKQCGMFLLIFESRKSFDVIRNIPNGVIIIIYIRHTFCFPKWQNVSIKESDEFASAHPDTCVFNRKVIFSISDHFLIRMVSVSSVEAEMRFESLFPNGVWRI